MTGEGWDGGGRMGWGGEGEEVEERPLALRLEIPPLSFPVHPHDFSLPFMTPMILSSSVHRGVRVRLSMDGGMDGRGRIQVGISSRPLHPPPQPSIRLSICSCLDHSLHPTTIVLPGMDRKEFPRRKDNFQSVVAQTELTANYLWEAGHLLGGGRQEEKQLSRRFL